MPPGMNLLTRIMMVLAIGLLLISGYMMIDSNRDSKAFRKQSEAALRDMERGTAAAMHETGAKTIPASRVSAQPAPPARPARAAGRTGVRLQFARAMAGVKQGMSRARVLKILGRPDDIRTARDPDGFGTDRTKEVWCYGAAGHLTFPTLGCVALDTSGRVQYVYGGTGSPPPEPLFQEDNLRSLLRLIDRSPDCTGYGYNPLTIIRIVNTLQPLGKERALAAISEYLRVATRDSRARGGLFLVLRSLFDVPEPPGHMPGMCVGMPGPPEPSDLRQIPRFPIVLQDDIPLMLVSGYTLAGFPEPVEVDVAYFRQHGRLRSGPLVPTDRPLESLDTLEHSSQWPWRKPHENIEEPRAMLMNELLRMLGSIYPLPVGVYGDGLAGGDHQAEQWKRIVTAVSALHIRWDPGKMEYTLPHG